MSIATVSNVLSNRANVGPVLARRVREAVDELGYVAHGAASRLRSGKPQALAGVVVPDLKNPFFAAFVSTLEQAARQDGFDLLVVSCAHDPEQEAERLRAIRAWRPAGLIVLPCDDALAARMPTGAGPPIVVADRIPREGFDVVAIDNHAAAAAVIRHLASEGVRSCMVAGSTLGISNIRERWEGALAAADGAMRLTMLPCGVDPDDIGMTLRRRLTAEPLPDALFALDTVTTLAAFQCLAALRLVVPDAVALAGFDDSEWMRLVSPGITAVSQPVDAMARAAWAQLMRRLAGDSTPPGALRLPCRLELRGSTRRRKVEGMPVENDRWLRPPPARKEGARQGG